MGNPLVSVVIPTFNRAKLCRKAVESVLGQTHGNLDVIVVDDGSNDNTELFIKGMDPRVRYIRQENAGVSAARNTGMDSARGDFIALLDSDDSWLRWKIEAQLHVLDRFPDAGMVWTDMIAQNENDEELFPSYLTRMYSAYAQFDREKHFREKLEIGEVWEECPTGWKDRFCYSGNIFPWMFLGNLVHTSTVLLRRERRNAVGGFDVSLIESGEDYNFHLRTCKAGDVAYLDLSSIRYRIGAVDQLTAPKYQVWVARNNLKTVKRVLEETPDDINLPARLIEEHMAESCSWVGVCELFEDRKSAREHLAESLSWCRFQPIVIFYYLFSLLPSPVANFIRNVKRYIILLK